MFMAKLKTYTYIIDRLTTESGEKIKKALRSIDEIKSISIRPEEGIVELLSLKDLETELKIACDIAGAVFRVKVKKRFFS